MPYLKFGRKKELMTEPKRANTDGDLNFMFTREYLKVFTAKPSYATIALIRKASIVPHKIEAVEKLEDFLTVQGISELDRRVARDLAYAEFDKRIVTVYEKWARMKNGDLDEIGLALAAIVDKFEAEAKV